MRYFYEHPLEIAPAALLECGAAGAFMSLRMQWHQEHPVQQMSVRRAFSVQLRHLEPVGAKSIGTGELLMLERGVF